MGTGLVICRVWVGGRVGSKRGGVEGRGKAGVACEGAKGGGGVAGGTQGVGGRGVPSGVVPCREEGFSIVLCVYAASCHTLSVQKVHLGSIDGPQ